MIKSPAAVPRGRRLQLPAADARHASRISVSIC
jgi:hypothetical protein